MSTQLVPCPACTRHVRVSEALCPFCAAALPDELRSRPPQAPLSSRLSRAATYALGTGKSRGARLATRAALAAAALGAAGCSAPVPLYGGPPVDLGTDTGAAPAYGAPADLGPATDSGGSDAAPSDAGTDAGIGTHYGGPPPVDAGAQDADFDSGAPAADYGSPPDV